MGTEELEKVRSLDDRTKTDRAWINQWDCFEGTKWKNKVKNLGSISENTKGDLLENFKPSKELKMVFLKKFKKYSIITRSDAHGDVAMKIIDDLTKGPDGLDISLFKELLQEGYEEILNRSLDYAKRISNFAKDKGINVKTTPNLLQKIYESSLAGGTINSHIKPLAKELGIELKPTKGALQSGFDAGLEDHYLEPMIEIYEFAKKVGFDLKISQIKLQGFYDERALRAKKDLQKNVWFTEIEKIAEFAKKVGIKLNLSEKLVA